jgi:hypothetical protein
MLTNIWQEAPAIAFGLSMGLASYFTIWTVVAYCEKRWRDGTGK